MDYYDQVREAMEFVREEAPHVPEIAVVLGSGLGDFASGLNGSVSMPYRDIPHWPASTVPGHEGRLVVGDVGDRTVAALSGRAHAYEGHPMSAVTFGTRVMGLLGVKVIIYTNAAGGINTAFGQGALMIIDDHINLTGQNPLIGPNDDRFGPRFPDMTEAYSKRLRRIADEVAASQGIGVAHGVYAGLLGPELRDAGRDPLPARDRRRRGWDVDGSRGARGAAHGDGGARHLVHHQHGGRRARPAAGARRGDGDGAAGARAVRGAARRRDREGIARRGDRDRGSPCARPVPT